MKCPIRSLSFNFRVTGTCSAECHKQHSWCLCSATNKATAKEWRLLPWQIEQESSREPLSQRWGFSGTREHNVTWSVCPQWTSGRAGKASTLGGSWGQGMNISYNEIPVLLRYFNQNVWVHSMEWNWFDSIQVNLSIASGCSRFESSKTYKYWSTMEVAVKNLSTVSPGADNQRIHFTHPLKR